MKNSTLYLFVKLSNIGKCQISIVATDPYGQSSFILVNVVISPCASKDCVSCRGNLQSDCLECVSGYRLDQKTGTCLEIFQYQSFILNSYFKILGFITFMFILAPILLSRYYGKITLYPILHFQIIIVLLFSNAPVSKNVQNYFEWLQIYKLDFGFCNYLFRIHETNFCSRVESENLKEMKFYCNGFVISYIYLILLILILIILRLVINWLFQKLDSFLLNTLHNLSTEIFSRSSVWWCFQNLFFIFPLCFIFLDIANIQNLFYNAFVSFILIIALIFAIIYTKFECISFIFVTSDVIFNKAIYGYIYYIRIISIICIVCMHSLSESFILKICFWCSQLALTIYIIILLLLFPCKDLLIMTIYNLSILISIPLYLIPISSQFQISVDTTFCLLLSLSVLLGAIVIIFPTNKVVKLCFSSKKLRKQN